MKPVFILCEESQTVCKAFRARGHEAYSVDLLPCSGGEPQWHIQEDAIKVALENPDALKIAFPPCDHLAVSGARWFPDKRADGRQQAGIEFFLKMAELCHAVENPIGIMSTLYRKPDQIVQPWQFGHGETKATCLWLRNLPLLVPTNIVDGREGKVWRMAPSADRSRLRSVTYQGLADAMANQWSKLL